MKLLVTGGAGFIGSNFVHYILREHPDWEVTNLDQLTYAGNLENLRDIESESRYRFIKGDITEREPVSQLLGEGPLRVWRDDPRLAHPVARGDALLLGPGRRLPFRRDLGEGELGR